MPDWKNWLKNFRTSLFGTSSHARVRRPQRRSSHLEVVELEKRETPAADLASFGFGNVFAAVNNGNVNEYTPTGTLVRTMNDDTAGLTAGMDFDSSGNLYLTGFSTDQVALFDPAGTLLGTFGSGYRTPESIVIADSGHVFVGNTGRNYAGNGGIREFDAAGNFLREFASGQFVDWIALTPDQSTILYTQEGQDIKAIDVATGSPLSDFTTGTLDEAFALATLPDGSVLVAEKSDVALLDPSGIVVQRYDLPGEDFWFSLTLDPDGTSFWAGDYVTGNVTRFDIATGDFLSGFATEPLLSGLAVFTGAGFLNESPVNSVPGSQITPEDVDLFFSAVGGNAISISDPDAGANAVSVMLQATNGTLTLGTTSDLLLVTGNGTAAVSFFGTITAVNTALDGLTFTPLADFNGPATLTITTDDLGNTGDGGAKNDTDLVAITVIPQNDRPIANDQTETTAKKTPVLITLTGEDGDPEVQQALTYTIVTGPTHGALSGFDPATGQVIYTPKAGFKGPDGFTFAASDDPTAGQEPLISEPGIVIIMVEAQEKPVTKPELGLVQAIGGKLLWVIEAFEKKPLGNQVDAVFTYEPGDGNTCKNITFLQVATATLKGKLIYPTDDQGKSLDEFYKPYTTKADWVLDQLPGNTDPYYGAKWDGTKWVSEVAGADSRNTLGNGPAGTKAKMSDAPFWEASARSGKGDVVFKFETAVFCIDTQEVLGVITWGFTIPDNPKLPIVLDKVQFSKTVSPQFKDAIQLANTVQGNKVTVNGKETTLNLMLHAQENGSAKITGEAVLPKK